MKRKMLFGFLLLLNIQVIAAKDPIWNTTLDKEINWVKVSPTGSLIASTLNALQAINPENGELLWKLTELKGASEESYEEVPFSPFIIVSTAKGLSGAIGSSSESYVLNVQTGQIIFNSKESGIKKINDTNVLEAINALLIEGVDEASKVKLTLVDFESGSKLWEVEVGEQKGMLKDAMSKMKNAFAAGTSPMIVEQSILVPLNGSLLRMEVKSGKILWNRPEVANEFFLSPNKEVIYGIYSAGSMMKAAMGGSGKSVISALAFKDGADVWAESLKLKGSLTANAFTPEGLVIAHSKGFNVYDYQTGQPKFKKEPAAYSVNKIRIAENGYQVEFNNLLWYIGKDGKGIWKKPVEVAAKEEKLAHLKVTSNGIFFVSPSMVNFIDLSTGKLKDKKGLKLKGEQPFIFEDKMNNKFVIYSDKTVYVVDVKTGSFNEILKKLKFEGKEVPVKGEALPEGYLLSSAQNAVLIDFSGKIIFQKYYKSIPASALQKTIGAAMMANNAVTMYNPDDAASVARKDARAAKFSQGNDMFSQRFSATTSAKNFMLILTQIEENESKFIGLVKIDKHTGAELDTIKLNDREPLYVVDEIGNKLFYVTTGSLATADLGVVAKKEIKCFNLD